LNRGDSEFIADQVAKFFDSVYLKGWFRSPNDPLASVVLTGQPNIAQKSAVGFDYPGVGDGLGFELQALLGQQFAWDLDVEFRTTSGRLIGATLQELSRDRMDHYSSFGESFRTRVNANPDARVLDIGGRDRSRFDTSSLFNVREYVVLDIKPGDNVDVVADAHEMSSVLAPESFDYVISASVFEHLLMPWKVALEINRVLKTGGLAWISTHQTVGMHDLPWDFWRFSDASWDAIFNELTGFRILDRVMDLPEFILPFVIREGRLDAENAAGFDFSAVLVEKTGKTSLEWPVPLSRIVTTTYPDTEGGIGFEERMRLAMLSPRSR
jgi:SAM-dependent methyltransferase